MEIELIEIRDFLASHPPFHHLPDEVLDRLPKQLSIRYFRHGTRFPPAKEAACLYLIRRGAVELRNHTGDLMSKLGEGDMCTSPCQADAIEASFVGTTAEDTLCYLLPCNRVKELKALYADFREHFDHSVSDRMRKALTALQTLPSAGSNLMTMIVGDMVRHEVVSAPPDTSIQRAAQIMSEHRVSSLLIMEGEKLLGLVTLRDLRSRVLAVGLPYDRPIQDIMTEGLHLLDNQTPGFQALIAMTRLNVHHLPVVDGDRVIGMLSTTDMVRHQSANAVYLVGDIFKARDIDSLAQITSRIGELQVHLVANGATADQVGQTVAAINDALTKRLLQLAEEQLGAPPVPYCWVTGGSQARREQTALSDQDNALIISDEMRIQDDAYFADLARFVCDGLNACGLRHCPGQVMATNPRWRQPERVWRQYFANWIGKPEPMSLLVACVFFDLRAIGGDESLLRHLVPPLLSNGAQNRVFIAYLVFNALKVRPPLGFFRNFVLIEGGDHDQTFDIKVKGIVPITDLARIYALSEGIDEVNTRYRLEMAAKAHALTKDAAADLIDAYEFIATLRVQHQVRRIQAGMPPDNYLSPDELSPLERSHLKEAFGLIALMQEAIGQKYQASRFA